MHLLLCLHFFLFCFFFVIFYEQKKRGKGEGGYAPIALSSLLLCVWGGVRVRVIVWLVLA